MTTSVGESSKPKVLVVQLDTAALASRLSNEQIIRTSGKNFQEALADRVMEVVESKFQELDATDGAAVAEDEIMRREIWRLVRSLDEQIETRAKMIAATAKERQEQMSGQRRRVSGYHG